MNESSKLQEELTSLRQVLLTYETSVQRKDDVISNLSRALQNQKEKLALMRHFSEWKQQHGDLSREVGFWFSVVFLVGSIEISRI